MRRMQRVLFGFFALACFLSIGTTPRDAGAELVPISGPPRMVYDTESGLDWLHLGETQGMSFNEILASLQPGGEFEGWQLGSFSEVGVLLAHGGMNFGGGSLSGSPQAIRDVLALLGTTFEDDNDPNAGRVIGAEIWSGNLSGLPPVRIEIFATADNDLVGSANLIASVVDYDEPFPTYAAGLRRAHVPVPEPAGGIACLAALASLLAIQRYQSDSSGRPCPEASPGRGKAIRAS